MAWNGFNISGTGILDDAQTAFDTVKSGLEGILELARAQAVFNQMLAGEGNAAMLLLDSYLETIINYLEALETTGLSEIVATPYEEGIEAVYHRPTRTLTLTPESALKQIDAAFDDEGDARRPWGAGNWGGLVVVASAAGLEEFFAILEAVGGFFNRDKLRKLAVKLQKHWQWLNEGFPRKKTVLSSGLDFRMGVSVGDYFPAFQTVVQSLKFKAIGIRRAIVSGQASWQDIIDFIDRQLAELAELAQRAQDFVDDFNFSLGGTGVYWRYFDRSTDTIESVRSGLTSGEVV